MATAGAGCDWRVFDDLADDTWVDSAGKAKDMNSEHFGWHLLVAGSGGSGNGVRFFSLGDYPPVLGRYQYSPSGDLSTASVRANLAVAGAQPFSASTPATTLVGTGDEGEGHVAVATTDSVDVPFVVLFPSQMLQVTMEDRRDVKLANIKALAAGTVDPVTTPEDPNGTEDLVAVGRSNDANLISVITDAANNEPDSSRICENPWGEARGVHVADVLPSAGGSEVLVSVGNEIRVVAGAGLPIADSASAVPCISSDLGADEAIAAPSGVSDLGTRMISGDFDGDGSVDVAASAPGSNLVVVYLDWDDDGPGSVVQVSGSGTFAAAIAAGDLDDDGKDELVISDPDATNGGKDGAGEVTVFSLNTAGDAFDDVISVYDATAEHNQNFGRSVAVARFGTDDRVLVVGAKDEVFTYFRLLDGDVRN